MPDTPHARQQGWASSILNPCAACRTDGEQFLRHIRDRKVLVGWKERSSRMAEQLTRKRKPGRKSKGERSPLTVRFHPTVRTHIERLASAREMPAGQFAADVMAHKVGRPDLMLQLVDTGCESSIDELMLEFEELRTHPRDIDLTQAPAAPGGAVTPRQPKGVRSPLTVRLAIDVRGRVDDLASQHAISASQFVADVMAFHVGLPHLVLELAQGQEVLRFKQSA